MLFAETSSLDFFGARTSSGAAMIWWKCWALVFLVRTVADPWRVLNLTMPCIVDSARCSKAIVDRPSKMLCSVGYRIIENSTVLAIRSLSSWLTNVKCSQIVPSGHKLCPMNLTNDPPVKGWSPSFHVSGSCRKQCS